MFEKKYFWYFLEHLWMVVIRDQAHPHPHLIPQESQQHKWVNHILNNLAKKVAKMAKKGPKIPDFLQKAKMAKKTATYLKIELDIFVVISV